MNPTIGWFPRYDAAKRITAEADHKWRAQWIREGVEIYGNGDHLVIDGQVTDAFDGNELSAGGGRWAALRTDPVHVYTSDGLQLIGAGCPAISSSRFAYVNDRQAATKDLILDGEVVSHGAITAVRISDQALVWSQGGETWGKHLPFGDARRIQVAAQEFGPVPIDTPEGPWVLTYTQTGFNLRPFGDTLGYRFDNGGQTYNPDGVYLNGVIYVVFTNDRGVIAELPFPLGVKRIDLSVPLAPPPHVPDPVPVPPKPPEPVPMADVPNYESLVKSLPLPLVELGVLNDRAEAIRAAKGEDAPETQAAEAAVNQVKGACCQTIVAALNAHEGGSAWGLLKKDSGQHWTRSDAVNLSTDIAFDRREMRLVDVMSDRAPSWDVHPADDQQPVEKFVAPLSGSAPLPSNPPPLDPGPPSGPDPGVAALQAEIDAIKARLDALDARPSGFPSKIALRTDNGHYVCAENGGGAIVNATRTAAGAWETFSVEDKS